MTPKTFPIACMLVLAVFSGPVFASSYNEAEIRAMFVRMPLPSYPHGSRRDPLFDKGVFRLFVDEKGIVTEVKVLRSMGSATLDKAVIGRFKQWLAKPGPRREVDIPVVLSQPVKRILINPAGAHYIRIESDRTGPLVTDAAYSKSLTYYSRVVKSPGREVTAFVAEGMSDADASRVLASFPYYSSGSK